MNNELLGECFMVGDIRVYFRPLLSFLPVRDVNVDPIDLPTEQILDVVLRTESPSGMWN